MENTTLNNHTLETYLELEANADNKYELYNKFIRAKSGSTPLHGELTANLITALNLALRSAGKTCKTYTSDVKVSIEPANVRCYPDLTVVCGDAVFDKMERRAITNPQIVVEILSDETEILDRGDKFRAYRQLPSMREYILVSQHQYLVEVFSRTSEGSWHIMESTSIDGIIPLISMDVQLNMRDIYFGVKLEA